MLQQTQVESVLSYHERWMARFPDVAAVAAAPEQDVLKAWEGLGYYARARGLRSAARRIMADHGGVLPSCPEALLALPGIGRYTAGAIASIAFNRDVPAVDGNVARVLSRLFALREPVNTTDGQARLWELAGALLPAGQARDFNQALMELGALICRAKSPACPDCPLINYCAAGRAGEAAAFPRKSPRPKRRRVRGVLLLPSSGGRILMRRRPSGGLWGGLWEFPWLEREPGESDTAAAARLLEELQLPGDVPLRLLGNLNHGLTHLQLELQCFGAAIGAPPPPAPLGKVAREAPPPAVTLQRWVTPAARRKLALARLSHKALELLPGEV